MARRAEAEEGRRWGELRPRRCLPSEEAADGRITILRSRYGPGRLGRFLERRFRPRPYRVHLDEVGSFVRKRCDGSTDVSALARGLSEAFGAKVEPAEERLVVFLTSLLRGRFASVEPPAAGEEPVAPVRPAPGPEGKGGETR